MHARLHAHANTRLQIGGLRTGYLPELTALPEDR
jgi:hypothetical protein